MSPTDPRPNQCITVCLKSLVVLPYNSMTYVRREIHRLTFQDDCERQAVKHTYFGSAESRKESGSCTRSIDTLTQALLPYSTVRWIGPAGV